MLTVCPAMRTVPERSPPLFVATRIVNDPDADPLPGPLRVSHVASATAVHEQPLRVSILTATVPPLTGTDAVSGETVKRHGTASCVTLICVLLTSRRPRRCTASVFGDTRYWTVAFPCPVASPVTIAHATLLAAVHVQSRAVVSSSVPDAPANGTEPVNEFSTETWHLTAVGAVRSVELDVQDSADNARTMTK